jgi:hypothetical protein
MKLRNSSIMQLCLASFASKSASMTPGAATGITLDSAPPEGRWESVPFPRRGYLWSPGYWDARWGHHRWAAGHWERQRPGYHLTQPAWSQIDNRWQLQRGHWEKGDTADDWAYGDGIWL